MAIEVGKKDEKRNGRPLAAITRFKMNLCQFLNKYIIANLTQNRKR